MKKLIGLAVAGLMFAGVACGGGGWSDKDKSDLNLGLSAARALGIFTDAQSDCVSDYAQSHYSGVEDMDAAPDSDGAKMFSACDIDPSVFEGLDF